MSDFFGLRVALSSMYAQRRGLEVTGHNVANVNTDGYSRQRVGLQAAGANTVPALHATWTGAGAGVQVTGVDRLRDQFLEARALVEHGAHAHLSQNQQVYARVELIFAEPGPNGLQAGMSELWAGWGDIANHPEDVAARAQLLERAKTLAGSVNRTRDELAGQWDASVEQLRVTVDGVNATAARVAELNGAIERAERSGLSSNDLADQRDRLALDLARAVGATVRPGAAGTVDVYLGGTALVRGSRAESLTLATPSGIGDAAGGGAELRWAKDGYPARVEAGQAGGLLDALNHALPGARAGIDEVAAQLAQVVNDQQAAGYDLDGQPGADLFRWDPSSGLAVVLTDPSQLAAAAEAPDGGPSVDGRNALAMAELATRADGPDDRYRSFIVALGVEVQATNRRAEIQADITHQIDAVRDAESGVNLDEEMVNMVAYQHAYNAAARLLTAIDEMLQTLVGGTGLVGR